MGACFPALRGLPTPSGLVGRTSDQHGPHKAREQARDPSRVPPVPRQAVCSNFGAGDGSGSPSGWRGWPCAPQTLLAYGDTVLLSSVGHHQGHMEERVAARLPHDQSGTSHIHTHAHTLLNSHTHTHTQYTYTHKHSHTQTHTHTLSHPQTLTHTCAHTCAHTPPELLSSSISDTPSAGLGPLGRVCGVGEALPEPSCWAAIASPSPPEPAPRPALGCCEGSLPCTPPLPVCTLTQPAEDRSHYGPECSLQGSLGRRHR